jgi:heparan-alpha-glucosaminide N-acetyltransferase
MGGYELVRSDDAAGAGGGADLESGAVSTAPAPAAARHRLVSLDVFRGITVLVGACN